MTRESDNRARQRERPGGENRKDGEPWEGGKQRTRESVRRNTARTGGEGKEKALAGVGRQSPGPRNGRQERSTLSEFLSPPVLDAGDVHPEVAPGERSGQDRQHCLPAALQVSASHLPESRAPVPSVSPPEWGQSRESHFPSATLEFTAQEITSDNKSTLCCVSGCAWALWSTGQRIVTFGEGSM